MGKITVQAVSKKFSIYHFVGRKASVGGFSFFVLQALPVEGIDGSYKISAIAQGMSGSRNREVELSHRGNFFRHSTKFVLLSCNR